MHRPHASFANTFLAALWLATLATAAAAAGRPATNAIDPALYANLHWRSVGPFRAGRVVAVTGVPGEPRRFYMGATGGGVWRTDDAGATWKSMSDSTFGTGSVGAIAVAPSDHNVVYVGMGETPVRGNVSHGDGVYRSTDGGRTWAHMGLDATSQIARIRVSPRDPDVAYVAALGHVFGPNAERGIYRTRDGGKTWARILFVNDQTGASDLAMDPTNPRVLYAGFWQVYRKPWTLESGGAGSSLWKSVDGGDTWQRLTGEGHEDNGLPKGVLGKICVTVSAARPERVWAMVEAAEGGLFRSEDSGKTWNKVNSDNEIRQRAWYFSNVTADTKDPDKVYALNVQFFVSKDGGRSFRPIRTPHGDNHDLWIDPDDSQRMIEGNDGGAVISEDGGATWSSNQNQPTAQFYHVGVDDGFPYRLYGSQQDNSSVCIPSRTTGFGIERTDWYPVGGGESGWIQAKPGDPNIVYAGSYDGLLTRFDKTTQQERDINAYPDNPMGSGAEGMKYRFQWTFPIVTSPHDPSVLYAAANVLFRTRDEGQSWEIMSPDLTRNDKTKLGPSGGPLTKDNTSVEYYCTIFTVAESPKRKGVIWAGSDDGLVHVTQDDGKTWTNVTPKDVPAWAQVNLIEASPFDAGTAYASIVRYKLGDFTPYVFVTHDFGKSWKRIVNGLPAHSFVRAVREDPERQGLLYAGTETGVWVSFDAGEHWQTLQCGLPVVPVTDLMVKNGDLCISTQGRAFWIMDDLSVLRQMRSDMASEDVTLFAPRTTVRLAGRGGITRPDAGTNPPAGAVIHYRFAKALPDSVPVSLEFLDAEGTLLRAFDRKGEVPADSSDESHEGAKVAAKVGLNEFAWDLDVRGATKVPGMVLWGDASLAGPTVVPGHYQARLVVGKRRARVFTQGFDVVKDPRLATTQADFQQQFDMLTGVREELSRTHETVRDIREIGEQIDNTVTRAKKAGITGAVADSAKALKAAFGSVEEALYQTKSKAEEDPLNYPIRLNNKLSLLGNTIGSADARPTDASRVVYDDLVRQIEAQLARFDEIIKTRLAPFNQLIQDQKVPAVAIKKRPAKATHPS